MFVADHLSRAILSETDPKDEDVQAFALELETMYPLSTVKISSESLPSLQKTTEENIVTQTLKNTILVG